MGGYLLGHRWDSKGQNMPIQNNTYQQEIGFNILVVRLISVVSGGVVLNSCRSLKILGYLLEELKDKSATL